ncbi:MAG: hypothetical protein ACOY71_12720 [Gemmatimonadota bacterium]
MPTRFARLTLPLLLSTLAAPVAAQGLPTSQPRFLTIYREEVKPGRGADHAKVEAGWPGAFAKARFPGYYLAMVSVTGPNEAWFISPNSSFTEMDDQSRQVGADPVLSAELDRLARLDAELLTGARAIQAVARGDLNHGAYPDIARQRFWNITWYRVRPGHEAEFGAAIQAFGAAAGRAAPEFSFRTYEIIAGAARPAFLVFTSIETYGAMDQVRTWFEQTLKGATPEELAIIEKGFREAILSYETNRYRLDPGMSSVSAEVRATDPKFWNPKKPAAKAASQP